VLKRGNVLMHEARIESGVRTTCFCRWLWRSRCNDSEVTTNKFLQLGGRRMRCVWKCGQCRKVRMSIAWVHRIYCKEAARSRTQNSCAITTSGRPGLRTQPGDMPAHGQKEGNVVPWESIRQSVGVRGIHKCQTPHSRRRFTFTGACF
jgi:hypothetical protein